MKGLEGRDEVVENSEKGIKKTKTGRSPEGDRIPPSLVAREVSNGSGHTILEKDTEDDMSDVMKWLFVEDNVSNRIKNPTPKTYIGFTPNFPWYFTTILVNMLLSYLKRHEYIVWYVRYKSGSRTFNSNENINTCNLGF